ncbi:hypothetical protein [Streptomyces roseochromogenus]|uniref:Uncharacterized protein n=1 Tax=Streptomyces roseochromogenus subsp. oscitans DS 12.976 TaxID=1352936 RepID=V6KU93_STRRC|nr:hypothetical protein [Streptomyces roseochromogenus]EST35593.1 hypothetical protein M878_05210 [Streptomyces roseochromogenus subsp. oscitans DS 12.976]
MLARLLLLARADGAERRSEVLRGERTAAARAALMRECANGRWSNVLQVHQLGLLAWLLGVAAGWLVIVHGCDPALLPERQRSARPEQFTVDGPATEIPAALRAPVRARRSPAARVAPGGLTRAVPRVSAAA